MFILIMQFFWVYIDDLMGKGLSITVILELLFYVSASLIPLALPLAVLLSSLITFGNMAENNELTALKSSGLSLLRIMRPLMVIVMLISLMTFYFANYVIPVANLKWHSLIYDIQNTKLTKLIKPGVYTTDLEGFAIKCNFGKESSFQKVIIYDHTQPNTLRTIKADTANLYKSMNGNYLFFDLRHGTLMEELSLDNVVDPKNQPIGKDVNHPDRISSFRQATYKLNVTGFSLKRSDEDIFQDKYEMLNVFQINKATDSIRKRRMQMKKVFNNNLKNSFSALYTPSKNVLQAPKFPKVNSVKTDFVTYNSLDRNSKNTLRGELITKLYQINQNVKNHTDYFITLEHDEDQYWIEFHRKFALTYAIIVLFFVGAPMGAIVKKGGFGLPVVISAVLFMIYFIVLSIGENLADTYVISPFWGMWLPSIFFTPLAIIITFAANRDLSIFQNINPLPRWRNAWKRK